MGFPILDRFVPHDRSASEDPVPRRVPRGDLLALGRLGTAAALLVGRRNLYCRNERHGNFVALLELGGFTA